MDSNLKETTSDVPSAVPTGKTSVPISSLPTNNAVSVKAGTSQPPVTGSILTKKHIIRKIIPLDPKKLQQAGLDRKIAEALSKQKSQHQSINQSNQNVDALPSHSLQIQTANTCVTNLKKVSKSTSNPSPAKNIDNKPVINTLNPPKITITGPEALTEQEKQNLTNLNPQQRLVHVKNLLNKKILEKKSKEMTDNSKTNQLLKTPQAIADRSQQKLHRKVIKEKPPQKKGYAVLKEPVEISPPSVSSQTQTKLPTKLPKEITSISASTPLVRAAKPIKTKTPQKSPQDIARKLVFQTDTAANTSREDASSVSPKRLVTEKIVNSSHPDDEEFRSCLNKDIDVIPKASITSANIQKQYKIPKQQIKKSNQVGEELAVKHLFPMLNEKKELQNFQAIYMKQQKIVKGQKLPKQQKLDFPEVSPLKEPFPTANVPKETPLPAIDSFKKPYALANTAYYNLQQTASDPSDYMLTNYENSLFNQQPTTSHASADSTKGASATNCLVVLENKVLSQDEMIDLTELRLSTNTSRFIHPHRPIPEVIIKEERPDDYQTTDASAFRNSFMRAIPNIPPVQDIKSRNNEKQQTDILPIPHKQKKFIINAQKLQLPPEQLADLARKIKQTTATNKTKSKDETKIASKYPATAISDSKISNEKPSIINANFILTPHPEMVAQTSNVMPQDFILPHNQMYGNIYNQDHDYYNGQNYFLSTQTSFDSVNTPFIIESNVQSSLAAPQLYNYCPNPQETAAKLDMTKTSFGSQDYTQSAVEIVDEPIETENSFSAIDFIATLGNTSAELSPEELNLSASCTFNQTFSPGEGNEIPQKTTSPNVHKKLLKSTIVIESSKGQETILTNKSPDKNDLEKVKEKIKIYHEMNKQKLGNKIKQVKSHKKLQHSKHPDDAQSRFFNNPKLYEKTNVSNIKKEELSNDQLFHVPKIQTECVSSSDYTEFTVAEAEAISSSREDLGKASFIAKTADNTCISEKSGTVSEPVSKPSTFLNLENNKEVHDLLETPKTIVSILNAKDACKDIVTVKEQTGNQPLEIESQTDSSAKTATEHELETLSSHSSNQEMSEKTSAVRKSNSEGEILPGNETISNAAIAAKRVSKFKKAKINLVPRKKSITAAEKKSADEINITNKASEQTSDEMNSEYKSKVNLEQPDKFLKSQVENAYKNPKDDKDPESKATANPVEGEIIYNQATEQSQNKHLEISQHAIKGNKEEISKLTKDSDQSERIEVVKQEQQQTPKRDTSQNKKNLETDLLKHINYIPKASIKTSPSTPRTSLKVLASKPTTVQVSTAPTQSLTKEVNTSGIVAMKSHNAEEKCYAQAVEELANKEKSLSESLIQNSIRHKSLNKLEFVHSTAVLETTHESTSNLASKEENKVINISKQSSKASSDSVGLQNNMDNNQTSQKSPEIENTRLKESSANNGEQDSGPMKNVCQRSSPKRLIGSMEKLEDPKSENLKKLVDCSDLTSDAQYDTSAVAKFEKEELNAFGLPKAITGRINILQEPKTTVMVSDNLKIADEVKGNNEDKCLKSFKAVSGRKNRALKSEDGLDETETFPSKLGILDTSSKTDSPSKSAKPKDCEPNESPLKIPKIEKTEIPKTLEPKSETGKYLNQHSQTILQTMKNAKISLIDIVKYSPIEQISKPPILPFKKSPSDSKHHVTSVSGTISFLNQLKKGATLDKNEEQKPQEPKTSGREIKKSFSKKEEQRISKHTRRSSQRTHECLTPPPLISHKKTRKTLSLRPLISDDDLEFLPENAEVNFNLIKSEQKEENKKSRTETRRKSPFTSTVAKRNRYYSQTLETDVTITFDHLKTVTDLKKDIKNLTEESCHESTQDPSFVTPIKQRKKLRKTVDDIKKSQNPLSDTDSEDFPRDYECLARDCEESNEFLGFEDNPAVNSSFENLQHVISETEHESKTKHGGLKNWLTTGKAISPTLDSPPNRKRFRQNNVSSAAASSLSSAVTPENKQPIRLKKHWDLCSKNAYEETDITDDTSPADDEEEVSEKIPLKIKLKRGIQNVIDSNKNAIESKKIKLNEDSFKLPAIIKNCDSDDRELYKEKAKNSQKLDKNNLQDSTKISNTADVDKGTEYMVENLTKSINLAVNSSKAHKELSKDQSVSETSRCDNESQGYKQTNSKQTAKYSKNENKTVQRRDNSKKYVEPNESPDNKIFKIEVSEEALTVSDCLKPKAVDFICTSDIEIKQMDSKNLTDSEDKAVNRAESQKNGRGRKSKANQKKVNEREKESPTVLRQSGTGSKKTAAEKNKSLKKTTINKGENSAIPETENASATPQNIISSIRKRSKSGPNDSSNDDSALLSNKKSNKEDIEDLDDNSLLTPLEITNTSSTENLNNKDCDSNLLPTTLDKIIEADNSMNNPKPKGKRGRQRNANYEPNFNSRLLLITKREQLDSDEILTETCPSLGSIQCGLCLARTEPSQWTSHLAQHYGIGWQVGEQKLNVESRTVVLQTMINYIKKNKCAGLACRMCQKVLRSALGLLTHIEQCGNQERGNCEYCKRNYAKNTLVIHLRSCKVRFALETEMKVKENQSENADAPEEIVGNSGRFKRHSTIKAENKLKVLGKELENFDSEESKLHIKFVPCLELNFAEKWSKEIDDSGQASCPKAQCNFTSPDINVLTEHVKTCEHMKSGYICNFCETAFQVENEAIDHIIANHQKVRKRRKSDDSDCDVKTDLELSSDDGDLSEGVDENESPYNSDNEPDDCVEDSPNRGGKNKNTVIKFRYHRSNMAENRKGVFDCRTRDITHEVAKKWNSFTKVNYSCLPLYNEFAPQYSILNYQDYERYLPTQTCSMKFYFETKSNLVETIGLPEKDINWSELKKFETIKHQSQTYCFLGAPIKLCSWLPLPADVNEQFLAVVYRQEMFKFVKFNQPKRHHTVVLVFKVTEENKVPDLSIHYGFVINDGPIHHLSFLPSGGYDPSTNRLGLVAVATVTSSIKVYSLPLDVGLTSTPDSTTNCNTAEQLQLIDVKPSFLLSLDVSHQNDAAQQQEGLLNSQCLQICWSELSGHHLIFAGFSNGFIAIWNIDNNPQQNLNRFEIADVLYYVPLNYFYLGEKSVKCLALHYDTLGPRWLVASTAYRKLIVFDIKNLMNPVVYKEEIVKNILLSMDWCPLWETFLISYDDALPNVGNGVLLVSPNNVMFQHIKLDGATTGVLQAHYSPVTNMCVTALNNGEIAFLNTKELHYDNCLSKKSYDRRAFYALDIKQLNGEPLLELPKGNKENDNLEITRDWVMHDHNYKEKYGLVFAPLLKINEKLRKAYMSEKRIPPPNVIPFMRVNTLRCNINQQGKHLVAAGYENGFLRLLYFTKEKVFSKL